MCVCGVVLGDTYFNVEVEVSGLKGDWRHAAEVPSVARSRLIGRRISRSRAGATSLMAAK